MRFPIFGTVQNYPEMLNKIAGCTFIYTLIATSIIRYKIHDFDVFLAANVESIPFVKELQFTLLETNFGVGTLLPAIAVSALARIFKLHDRISDLFRIRHRFDVNFILVPLATGSGKSLTANHIKKINDLRRELMPKVFYKYASSSKGRSQIDEHLIIMALDMWSWYWIILEIITITIIAALILLIYGSMAWSGGLFAGTLVGLLIIRGIKPFCERYAGDEVREILTDPKRKQDIAGEFSAL